ncbi:MAG: hypothetical protein PGN13_08850 [Patulibacter minatonensis]
MTTADGTTPTLLLSPAALGLLGEFLPDRADSPFAAPVPDPVSHLRRATIDGLHSRGLLKLVDDRWSPSEELAGLIAIADAASDALAVTIAGAEQASVTWLRSDAATLEQRWAPDFAAYAVQAIPTELAARRAIDLATSPAPLVDAAAGPAADAAASEPSGEPGPDLGPETRLICVERRRWQPEGTDDRVQGLRLEWVDAGTAGRWLVDREGDAPVLRELPEADLLRHVADLTAPATPSAR